MAKWASKIATYTPVAVGDGAAMTFNSYHAISGFTATQRIDVVEVYLGGQATASAPTFMLLARDSLTGSSTAVSTVTGGSNAPIDPATNTLVSAVCFTSSVTHPQRSAAAGMLNLSYNAFGGIVRWVAPPGSEIKILGSTQPFGELSLSAYTGGTPGLMGSHIIYETI